MAMLKRISISGYKSIEKADIELRPMNVLIGANGAGKSNLISVFKLLREAMRVQLAAYVGSAGWAESLLYRGAKRTPHCDIEIDLEANDHESPLTYAVRLAAGPSGALIVDREVVGWGQGADHERHESRRHLSESAIDEAPERAMAAVRRLKTYLSQIGMHHMNDTSPNAGVRQPGFVDDNRELRSDGSNLAAVLYRLQKQSQQPSAFDYHGRIVKTIRMFAPWFGDFSISPWHPPNRTFA